MSTEAELFSKFLEAGNTLSGEPPIMQGKSALSFRGKNSNIKLGKNVTFKNVRIEMLSGSGSLIVGDNTKLNGLIQIAAQSVVEIGENTIFNRSSHLSAWEGASIKIGNNCLCSNVEIRTSDMHTVIDLVSGSRINPPKHTIIEDEVWLGESVTVYKGVTVGRGSIVGGHSVVTASVPRHTAVVGVPAKVIKRRVSWQRELIPMAPIEATPVSESLATKEEMAQIIKDGHAEKLIYDIDTFMKITDSNFENLEGYAQFYYARSQYLCGNFKIARELLQLVIYKMPHHKVAIDLLSKIPSDL
jgi:acetyltransferase-like isoleucine patch superfamily enzyme